MPKHIVTSLKLLQKIENYILKQERELGRNLSDAEKQAIESQFLSGELM